MRTGIPTLHQALTPEAATILKFSLSLAQRRNHAQVTPLHVATTLLTTSTSPSLCTPTNLLKRACLKSQQQPNYQNTLLHCRALELCFNVALNRLPTCTSPSSSSSTTNCATTNPNTNSLMHASYPTLSNALVAALKRAQANQRRGCIELQQQQSQLQQNQLQQNQNQNQNQPLLAIKVELEQLIISILDDPSVSRVMREAGFSSSLVKSSLEEEREKECSVLGLGQNKDLWQSQFIKPIFDQDPLGTKSQKEDLRLIFQVMGRKMHDRKRNNPILVGDSVSLTESLVEEVKRRLERGDVPDELKRVQFVNFGISTYMQLGLIGKGGLEAKVEELKRNLGSSNGVVIYVGDLKLALVDETMAELDSGFSPIRYIVEEIEKLVCGSNGGKVWVLGIASYQTYMQVMRRRPSLEVKWSLHAVTVPSGGLSLSLQAPAQRLEPRVTSLNQSSYQLFEIQQKVCFAPKEEGEEEREVLCFECNANYEREASIILSSDSRGTGGIQLPSWLRPNRPIAHHKVNLMELRSKWSRLCQKLHQYRNNNSQFYPSLLSSNFSPKNLNLISPIWGPCKQNKPMFELNSAPFQTNCPKTWPLEVSRDIEIKTTNSGTNLFLGGLFNLSDSATSEIKQKRKRGSVEVQELEKRLYENIPWQSGAIASIVEAFDKKENLMLLEGNDQIAKRRVALVIAETYCGSADKVIRVDPTKIDIEIISKEVEREKSCVVLIEDINEAPADVLSSVASLKDQSDAIIILTVSQTDTMLKRRCTGESHGEVKMRFLVEMPSDNDLKRKSPASESVLQKESKRQRGETGLDLNLCASEDEQELAFNEEEAIPSDITHEGDGFDRQDLPQALFHKIGAHIVLGGSDSFVQISNRIVARLNCACAENRDGEEQVSNLNVDKEVVEWLFWGSGSFL